MKNSFKIFSVIVGLLVVLIILRLNSISYPRDIEDNTEVIYLEEFHDHSSLFDIEYKGNRFWLKPLTIDIKVRGIPAVQTIEIGDNDLITVENRRFLLQIFPHKVAYREVFRRPMIEVFPGTSGLRYIGGWTKTDRKEILSKEENQALLKKLLVEIAADELKRTFIEKKTFDGKLLELMMDAERSNTLQVKSLHLQIIKIRDWQEQRVKRNTLFTILDGDILKIPYRNSKAREGLFIKFNMTRSRGVDYLVISYKGKPVPQITIQEPGQKIAFLKSLDTGITYNISKKRKNAFIGSNGLYSFNLNPGQLLDKLYIPDKIPEGGMVDIKELLDRHMYYRKGNRFYPVTREFLYRLKDILKKKNKEEISRYFRENNITWREFNSYNEYKRFMKSAESFIRKAENKGIFKTFAREIQRLNIGHQVLGVGLGVNSDMVRDITYKTPGHSWLSAGRVEEHTPIITGISTFYWGDMIKNSDEAVEFKIKFQQPASSLRVIAAADYGFSFDGKQYTTKNFFDGVQTIVIPKRKKEIFIKVWNLKTFNKIIGSINLQVELVLKNPGVEDIYLSGDSTWEASINGVHWSPARVNPPFKRPDPGAGQLDSIWYDEKWAPVYRGIKFRYFRKKFELEEIPQSVTWKIYALGNYMLRVNRKIIQTGRDFIKALKKGRNVITVMVTRQGFIKRFGFSSMFKIQDNCILLKHRQVQRASFKRAALSQKALVSDINNNALAYSSEINGKSQRFYTPQTLTELLFFLGSPGDGIWGLEQIFSKIYRENQLANIQLTINQEWQSIVLEAMKKILYANREKELKSPEYKKLLKELAASQAQLQKKRDQLPAGSTASQQLVMQTIIQLQDQVESIKSQISKIKNHFYEAAVVLMSHKGEIRTAASYPYNEETMKALNPGISKPYRPRENPYFNKSWQWNYNPGSTAKVLDCVAFLDSKDKRDEKGRYLFPYLRTLLTSKRSFKNFPRLDLKGSTMLNGKEIVFRLRNFQGHIIPEGFCSLEQALSHSYNTYFSYLALHNNRMLTHDSRVYDETIKERYKRYFISKANIPITRTYYEYPSLEFAERLLMNRKIDLLYNLKDTPFESKLVRMPNDAFMAVESIFPINAYTPANIAHYSIGQGNFQLTTLQNAVIVSTILNRGVLYYPSIIQSIRLRGDDQSKPGKSIIFNPEKDKINVFKASIADQIKEAMKDVIEHGTAIGLFREIKKGREFYAKTGTAETELYKDNSLFVGFVMFQDGTPLIFSVIVPRSGIGAKVAGKLTEDILKAIIDHENKKGGRL
ncbi:penicillin-binding transpeptidase domain-containing protein [Acidobacteriota bacterium]